MVTRQSKNREYRITSSDIQARFIDGRIIDEWEMYDRLMLSRQIGLIIGMPQKRTSTRVG
jgi:hypothetical protein